MLTATKPKAKLSVAELSALYDRIYDIADRLIKKYNSCGIQIKGNKCICNFYTQEKTDDFYKYSNYGTKKLCCIHCNEDNKGYWSESGCTVKALACKLFYCPATQNRLLKKRLKKLMVYSRKHLSFNYYESKEDWLKQMKE